MALTTIEQARSLHRTSFVADCHSDVPVDVWRRRRAGDYGSLGRVHLKNWQTGGLDLVVLAVGGDQPFTRDGTRRPTIRAFEMIDDTEEEVRGHADIVIVTTQRDLERLGRGNRVGVVLHFEGCRPLAGKLELLRSFYRAGLRSMQLT